MSASATRRPWGVAEFVRLADAAGLPRIASVQNAYSLVNRSVDNGLDELMQRCQVSLLAYSPLAFGLLSGKYDVAGFDDPALPGRMAIFASMRKQRHGRAEALAAARRYNALAREHGLTPDAAGAGLLLPQLARRQHHHRHHHASSSSTRTSMPGTPSCRRSCWRPSTASAGRCATRPSRPPWQRRNGTSARRRPRSGCADTAWPSPSIRTTTSSTAAPPNRRASSAWTSMRW